MPHVHTTFTATTMMVGQQEWHKKTAKSCSCSAQRFLMEFGAHDQSCDN